jgi:tetratricopeptide (TPR) repeat protein
LLEAAVAELPDDVDLREERARAAQRLKQFAPALNDMRWVAQHRPADWLNVARIYNQFNRQREGIEILTDELSRDQNNVQLQFARGMLSFWHGQWGEAVSDLTAFIDASDDVTGLAHGARAYGEAELEQWDAASKDYQIALKCQPSNGEWQNLYAHVLFARHDLAGFKEAVGPRGIAWKQRNTSNAWALAHSAWVTALAPEGDHQQALKNVTQALKMSPNHSTWLTAWGLLFYRNKQYQEALEKIQAAIKVQGKEGTVYDWLILAMAHHQLKQPDEARRWFKKAETLLDWLPEKRVKDPRSPQFWNGRLTAEMLRREAAGLLNAP